MSATALLASSFSDESSALADRLRQSLVAIRSRAGGGSGTAWTADGLIVTNNHVVGDDTVTVVLPDDSEHAGTVEARDPDRDLALVRVEAALTPAIPGDSAGARPGSLVFAIGNPWGLRGTLTSGIVFARGDALTEAGFQLRDVIRADLQLAPGNSGGPMTDAAGRVIGINSMIVGGMAIAIPTHAVLEFIASAEPGKPGFLGVAFQPVRLPSAVAASYQVEDETALMLTGIEPGSAAERAGLLPGDILLGAGSSRHGVRGLARSFRSLRAGKPVELALLRGGRYLDVAATPGIRES